MLDSRRWLPNPRETAVAKVLVEPIQRIRLRDDTKLKLLLLFTPIATVGFGDISPILPLSRMVSVAPSIAGPLYLAAVMGVLISRFSSSLDRQSPDR